MPLLAHYIKKICLLIVPLLFTATIFAITEEELSVAIGKNDTQTIQALLEKDIDFTPTKNIFNHGLPSNATLEILLNNKIISPNQSIALILEKSLFYNIEKQIYEADSNIAEQQYILISLALDKGANPNNIQFPEPLYLFTSIKTGDLLLKKGLNPTKFLQMILQEDGRKTSVTLVEQQYNLAKLAIENNADVNDRLVFKCLENINNHKVIELLFNNGNNNANPKTYCNYLKRERTVSSIFGYDYFSSLSPQAIIQAKYQYLNQTKLEYLHDNSRVPRVFHHIWITNEKAKKEISAEDIQHILNTNKIINQQHHWEHILWTNNKKLIPNSVATLEANGIQVKEISTIKNKFRMAEKIDALIENSLWGLAFDALRLEILRCRGGVISDINFVFTRNLEPDVNQYDFFTNCSGVDNYSVVFQAVGAIPYHPIIEEALDLIRQHYNNQKIIVDLLGLKNPKEITYTLTGHQLTTAYYKYANKNGTVDILYPYYQEESYLEKNHQPSFIEEYLNDYCNEDIELRKKHETLSNMLPHFEICGFKDLQFGHDTSTETWVNSEETKT